MSELPSFAPGTLLASGLRHVEQVLAEIPPGKTRALVVISRIEDGTLVTRSGFAWRLGNDWALAVEAETDWRERVDAQVGVRWAR